MEAFTYIRQFQVPDGRTVHLHICNAPLTPDEDCPEWSFGFLADRDRFFQHEYDWIITHHQQEIMAHKDSFTPFFLHADITNFPQVLTRVSTDTPPESSVKTVFDQWVLGMYIFAIVNRKLGTLAAVHTTPSTTPSRCVI
jgi:hypothetical protein